MRRNIFKVLWTVIVLVRDMAKLIVEIPDELKAGSKEIGTREVNRIVSEALREKLSEKLMFKVADELLKGSEITEELALKWGSELKEKAAKKRGS